MSAFYGFLFRLVGLLPLRWTHALGAVLGKIMLRMSPAYARALQANMALAGYTDVALTEKVIAESGKMVLEWAFLWNRDAAQLLPYGQDRSAVPICQDILKQGKGIIFLTPHLGCFECTAQGYAALVGPITVLYTRPKLPWLQKMIDSGRNKRNVTLAPADLSGVRTLMRALKNGEAIGILPDQTPREGEGVWAPFFGKPAYTMTLVQRLHETFGAPIVLAWGERLPNAAGFTVRAIPFAEPLERDPLAAATQLNRALEAVIRTCPEQYLWGYNRYKAPKDAKPQPSQLSAP